MVISIVTVVRNPELETVVFIHVYPLISFGFQHVSTIRIIPNWWFSGFLDHPEYVSFPEGQASIFVNLPVAFLCFSN